VIKEREGYMGKARNNYLAALRLIHEYINDFKRYPYSDDLYCIQKRNEIRKKIKNMLKTAEILRINAEVLPKY
jgi:hypothetical protein